MYQEFSSQLLIRESHLDTFGHMNNATYLEIFEEARWDIITSRDFGLPKIKASGLGPVILEIHLTFNKELKLRQQVAINSVVVSSDAKIAKMRQWIEDEAGNNCCEALFTFALFNTQTRKIVTATPEWLYAIGIS